ncbi:energy transducer TonB family protein [Pyxidicoccus xibeiensis]|uniref:energy transducer TonB family protein n=1 Tax=Pyxidicoccus xibeiensis TaxID=2906759 RepID=UPI0020A7AA95|nr:TonB family protein [Pyxidicoccus xibeiensis]MCP3142441.1 energy transducer TonB [Pyxidicoccus xibeiensis]
MSTGPSPTDWRRRKRRGSPWRLVAAVALALLVHVAYVGAVLLAGSLQPGSASKDRKPVTRPTSVAVRPLTADQWAKNRGKNAPSAKVTQRPRAQEKKPEEKKPETRPEGQVVDVAPGNEQEAPDAKYLAESNNRVDKETRAREQTPFYRNATPQRTAPKDQQGADSQAQAPRIAGNNGMGNDDNPMSEAGQKSAFEIPDARRKSEVAVKTDPNTRGPGVVVNPQNESDEVVGNSKRLRIQPGLGEEQDGSAGRVGAPGVAALMPSRAVMDKVLGAAPNDHLDEADEGDATLLNTREWKYASFFNRVKQSVGMHWNPNEQLRRRDPTGSTYSGKDRYTLLEITLDEKGQVKDIQVEKSSGLDFLDLEAVSSFKRAQPFPNPPPGLLSQDAEVKFQFGFFMEFGGGPRMRLFRQPN